MKNEQKYRQLVREVWVLNTNHNRNIGTNVWVYVLLLMLFSLTCYSQTNEKRIVLIVKDAPNQSHFERGRGAYASNINYSDLSYLDDDGAVRQKRFKIPSDTVVIKVKSPYLEIGMQFKGIEETYFLLKNGDTIDVTYQNQYPYLKSRSDSSLTYCYNLAANIPNRTAGNGFDVLTVMGDNLILCKRLKENPNYPKLLPEIYKDYKNPFELAKQQEAFAAALKDSLAVSKSRVDSNFYSYYLYQLGRRENVWTAFQVTLGAIETLDISKAVNDNDVKYISYRRLLKQLFISPFICRREWIVKGKQSSTFKYDMVFSYITGLNFPPKSRNILLEFCVENVIENGSAALIKDLTAKFVELTGNNRFVNDLLAKAEVTYESGDRLNLTDATGKTTNFEEILKRNRGKVVYVDFWASWCAPCKAAMPDALNLRKEFKGKEVVFVYLALNDKREPWKAAVKRYNVDYLAESYLITNSRSSDFLTNMSVKLIPRYMLFDKKGVLIHANAPGPGGGAIRSLLRQQLAGK